MSTGPEDGAYHAAALRYRAVLAQYGIDLRLLTSAGATENLERLKSRTDGTTVALVQGGLSSAQQLPGVVTLGSVFYEPLWIFYRSGREMRSKRDWTRSRCRSRSPRSSTTCAPM